MRYLYTVDGKELFAYAPGRRDFFRASDDTLWAHESHEWLIAATSGEAFAHRTGDVYYGAASGEGLYREGQKPTGNAAPDSADTWRPTAASITGIRTSTTAAPR